MKVLFLNVYDDPARSGGTEATLANLAQGMLERSVTPILVSTHPGRGQQTIERDGVRIRRCGLANIYWPGHGAPAGLKRALWHGVDVYNPWMQAALHRVLVEEQPDVVSVHNLPGWSVSAWSALKNFGVPFVQVLHDQYALCPRCVMFKQGANCESQCFSCRILRLPHRYLSRLPSAVVGVSQFILDRHLSYGLFRQVADRYVIPDARNPRLLGCDPLDAPSGGEGNGHLRFGYIGRLSPEKGVSRLIEAFLRLNLNGAELLVAGRGDSGYEQTLRDQAADAPITFLGRVPAAELYRQVDAVVVPSCWHDTLPGVVYESFAFGKPVIGSRRGGIPEMVKDHHNGLLFEPERPGELEGLLQRLVENPAWISDLGASARASARDFLDTRRWTDSYLKVYSKVAQGSP